MTSAGKSPSLLVLYHYLHPDDVVSSVIFSQLCTGLAERGWRVAGIAGNRGHRDERVIYESTTQSGGATFRHVWRPRLAQSSTAGRLLNAAWMLGAWSLSALNWRLHADVVIVGTDPVLSPLVTLPWRLFRPNIQLVHWCFDLYPEAAIEDGLISGDARLVSFLRRLLKAAYRRFNLLIDIGECMKKRISLYATFRIMVKIQ